MRKSILLVAALFVAFNVFSQNPVFWENFDTIPYGSHVTSSSSGTTSWGISTQLSVSGMRCDTATVVQSDTLFLTSNAFSTTGSSLIYLEFDQIAKIEFLDAAYIEVSNNNGAIGSWTKLTGTHYLGTGNFGNIGNKFTATSYPIEWLPANDNAIPTNAWWKHEKFDLSSYIANVPQAKIRFVLADGNNTGSVGNYGWLLDNINVWVPANQEASAEEIQLPFALPSGCGLGNEIIKLRIANNGGGIISGGLTASFQRDNGTVTTETVSNTIPVGDTIDYTFNATIDLSSTVDTNYQIRAWVNLTNDPYQLNDTISDSLASRVALPYPAINDTTIPYGTSVTLHATHTDSISWFSDPIAQNLIHYGSNYTTPILFDTAKFYCQAGGGGGDEIIITEIGLAGTDFIEIQNLSGGAWNKTGWVVAASASYTVINSVNANLWSLGSFTANQVKYKTDATTDNYWGSNLFWNNGAPASFRGWAMIIDDQGNVVDELFWGWTANDIAGFSATINGHVITGASFDWTGIGLMSFLSEFINRISYNQHSTADWVNQTTGSKGLPNPVLTPVGGSGGSAGTCPSAVKTVTVNVSAMPLYNSGVTEIISPVGAVTANSTHPVKVAIKNYAGDTLKKVTIGYSVNGIVKTPFVWTGNLLYNDTTHVTINSETFLGGVYSFKAWTSLPNDSVDGYPQNDTAITQAYVCLAGTFTLGDASSDFADFAALNTVLANVGLCGPTIIRIKSGTYNEQLTFTTVNGVNSTNTLTFQSYTGVNTDVVIQPTASSTATWVVRLNGADYIAFKNLSLKATGSITKVVDITGVATHNVFEGCIIDQASSASGYYAIYDGNTLDHYNTYKDNVIKGGYYGMYVYGTNTTTWQKGTVIEGNEIINFGYAGMFAYYHDSIQIINNYVHSGALVSTTNYGINATYINNAYRISGNKVVMNATGTNYGIRDYYGNYYSYNTNPTGHGLVYNNMISITAGTSTNYGFYAYYSNGTEYYYNSVNLTAGSTSSRALYQANTASNTLGQKFKNNIFSHSGVGYAAYFNTPAQVSASDYNDFYATGNNLAYWSGAKTSLAALQSASGKDANSVSVDPQFMSNVDLHASSVGLNAAATPVSLVIDDIDGEPRDTITPDIGADEYLLIADDAGIFEMVSPITACPGDTSNIIVQLRNFGTDTLFSAIINWTINDTVQTASNFSGTLLPGQSSNELIGTYVFQAGIPYKLDFWSSNPNGPADGNPSNDSLTINPYKTSLPNGTFTIGADSTDDYPSFTAAINDLNAFGICGPVVFDVDAGTYNESVSIGNILGVSSINTVTFQSANGDSSSVILTGSSCSGIVKFSGSQYIIFKSLTIHNTSNTGRCVEIMGGANHNTITNCIIKLPISTSTSYGIYNYSASKEEFNTIKNNVIQGGYYGLYWYGQGSAVAQLEKGSVIEGNHFIETHYYGIYAYYQDSIYIIGNTFTNTKNHSNTQCQIRMYYCDNNFKVVNNKLNYLRGYGLYMYYCDGTSAKRGLIANNMISQHTGNSNCYGIYARYPKYTDVYYNSIKVKSAAVGSYGFYWYNSSSTYTGHNIKNNNFVNLGSGYAVYIYNNTYLTSADYNNYYSPTGSFVYWQGARANLTALKSAYSNRNQHSISADPIFISAFDLHTISPIVDGMGTPLALITNDIDGQLRDLVTPDIGADEFIPPPQDATMLGIISPDNGCGLDTVTITVQLKNTGLDTINGNLVVKYNYKGDPTVNTEAISSVIAPGDTLVYTFAANSIITSTVDSTFNFKAWCALPLDPYTFNDTAYKSVFNGLIPINPVTVNDTINYGTITNIGATSSSFITWYENDTIVLPLGVGTNYTTPVLFDTTVYYAQANSTNGCQSFRESLTVFVTGIPAGDVGVAEIFTNQGCGLDSNEAVMIAVYNQGYGDVNGNISATFKVDNHPWITTETITDTIGSHDTIWYTFNTPANLYALSDTLYNITAAVTLTADPYQPNDTLVKDSIESLLTPLNPVFTSPITVQYGNDTTLAVISADSIFWYAQFIDTVEIGAGTSFQTPPLYDTTTYWVQAGGGGGAPDSLTTTFVAGNGQSGNMFDITAKTGTLTIDSFYMNGTSSSLVEVWYRPGTYVGHTSSNAGWTKLGDHNVTSAGTGNPTQLPVGGLTIPSGLTYGIYITYATGSGIQYTNGNGTNEIYQNTDIKFEGRHGGAYFSLTFTPRVWNGRIFYHLGGAGAGGCSSDRIPFVVNTTAPPPIDAGVLSIESPLSSSPSGVSTPIIVRIKNFGTNTLQSANLTYALNGVVKSTYAWTGSVIFGDTSAPITIATDTFVGGIHNMCVWVSNANGSPTGGVNANDTLCKGFNACLNGTYSLGSPTSDFPTFADAFTAIDSAGICGHVIFNIDSGIYNVQLNIGQINGVGPNSTVTFQSVTGDSTDVTIQYAATATNNGVVHLNGADYLRFKNLTIKATGSTYAWGVFLTAGAEHNIFEGNIIKTTVSTSGNSRGVVLYLGALNQYNTFKNNVIENGYYGIYCYGLNTTTLAKGNVFEGNEITNPYYYSTYFYYQDSLQFVGNSIDNANNSGTVYGFRSYYCDHLTVTKNNINIHGTSTHYGMYIYYADGSASSRSLIANNFVSLTGTGTGTWYGTYLYNSTYVNVYHNSYHIIGGSATAGRAFFQSLGSNQNYKNNIFSNSGLGYAAYFNTPAAILSSDYNDFYSTASNLAYWSGTRTTLAALQLASGKDAHSVNINPPFTSNTDLHLATTVLSGLGTQLSTVTVDIDGDSRSPMPTIGADEVPLIPIDAGVFKIIQPTANAILNEGASTPVSVVVTNFGTDTIFGMNIQYSVNNGTAVQVAYNDTLLSFESDTVIMPNFTATAGNSNICAKTLLTGDINYFNDEYCQPFFGIPSKDASVTRILDIAEGCGLGLDTVMIWIRNIGVDTINGPTPTTMTAHYQLDGLSPIVTENMSLTINPGDSALFVFNSLADFSTTTIDSVFDVAAWVNLTGDNVSYNDTAYTDVNSLHIPAPPIVTSPITVPYASPATLSASSLDPLTWFADDTTSVILATGPNYTTPLIYTADTFYVQAGMVNLGAGNVNIAPLAVASASPACNTGPCTTLNDLNFGNCGSQQMWITSSSSNPGSNVNVTFIWPTARSFNKMTIHVGQNNTRFLTGGTIQIWNGSTWTNHHTFTQAIGVCFYDINFPIATTTRVRIIDITVGGNQQSNVNFREIEIFEALVGCSSVRVPVVVNVSAPKACDVGVFSLVEPVSSIYLSASEQVKVLVKNYGTVAQTNIPVSYQLNNGTIITDTITSTILPSGSYTHTFGTTANLSIPGSSYSFKAYTSYSCDSVQVNDTIWSSVQNLIPNYCPSAATYATYHDIENVTFGAINNTSPSPFNKLYTDYTSVPPAMIAPSNTYPISIKINSASSSSYSGYVEVYIDYNRNGAYEEATETAFGTTYSSASSSNPVTVTGNIVIPSGALNGLSQMRVVAERSAINSGAVHPCGTYNYGETEDYSVIIAPKIHQDGGIVNILQPTTIPASASTPIEVIIVNYGIDLIDSIDVSYQINSSTPVKVTLTDTIPPLDSLYYTFPTILLPTGQNTICAYTTLVGDSNIFNDQHCITSFIQLLTPPPYFDNFEGVDFWLADTLANQWQRGTPNAQTITSAHSPSNAWMIQLDTNYNNNSFDYLYTPKFVFGLVSPDSLSFWHYVHTQITNDGGRIQYLNNTGFWSTLGILNDANGTNWYNTTQTGIDMWTGNSSGWQLSTYDLSSVNDLANIAQFRFIFSSNNTTNNFDGWAIDDFRITVPKLPKDAGVTAIVTPVDSTMTGSNITVQVTIKNSGTDTLKSIPVNYAVTGQAATTEIWTGYLLPNATDNYTFTTPYQGPNALYELCAWTSLTADTHFDNDSTCKNISTIAAADDVGIIEIINPDSLTLIGSNVTVIAKIKNHGTNTVTSIPIEYEYGINLIQETWTGTLLPNATENYTFTTTYPSPIGNYTLCVRTKLVGDADITNDEICENLQNPWGIDEFDNSRFILFQNVPNPTKGITTIGYIVPKAGKIRFEVINLLGKIIYYENNNVLSGKHQIDLDVNNLPSGIYYYSIIFDGKRLVKKMVKN